MSLNDHSIRESRDAEFSEYIFPLKNNVLRDAQNNASMSMSINLHVVPSYRVTSNELENELRRSKSRRIETSVCPDFITTFLTENFDINILNDELVSIYLIEGDSKTYDEAMISIDVIFWKEAIKR